MDDRSRSPARVLYLSWNRVVSLNAIYEVTNHRIAKDRHSWFQRWKERAHPRGRRTIVVAVVKRKVCNHHCALRRRFRASVPNLDEAVTNLLHPGNRIDRNMRVRRKSLLRAVGDIGINEDQERYVAIGAC